MGTLSGEGLYLTVYPLSGPNMDTVSTSKHSDNILRLHSPDVNFTRSIVSKRHRQMEWGNREAKNLNFEILSWHAACINFNTLRGDNGTGHCIH